MCVLTEEQSISLHVAAPFLVQLYSNGPYNNFSQMCNVYTCQRKKRWKQSLLEKYWMKKTAIELTCMWKIHDGFLLPLLCTFIQNISSNPVQLKKRFYMFLNLYNTWLPWIDLLRLFKYFNKISFVFNIFTLIR